MKQKLSTKSNIPSFLFEKFDYDQDLAQIGSQKNILLKQQLNIGEIESEFKKIMNKLDLDKIEFYVRKCFNWFDIEKTNEIEIEDIKNCLFALNLCPTESQVNEIYKQMNVSFGKRKKNHIDQAIKTKINFETFSGVMIPILALGVIDTRSEEMLVKAFRVMSDGKDKIDWKKFEDLLCSNGDKFKNEEIELMKEFANKFIDRNSLLYKSYIPHLTKEIDHESFFKNSNIFSQKKILSNLGFSLEDN